MPENVKERVLRYLNDAHAAEDGALSFLRDFANETTNPDVKAIVIEHIAVTQSQMDRVAARIKALGGEKAAGKGFLNTLLAKSSEMLNVFHDREDKETQDLLKAYAMEHLEVGMYMSLKAFADAVGDYETAQLADAILGEEQLAAERLLRVVPQVARTAVATSVHTGYPT
jgi:ferritin-like metal-binding protein YciE